MSVEGAPATFKPKSSITVKFSEKMKGISEKSMKLYRLVSAKKKELNKAKVTLNKRKTKPTLNPKGSLRRASSYTLVFNPRKFKDRHGNALVQAPLAFNLRTVVPMGRVPDGVDG